MHSFCHAIMKGSGLEQVLDQNLLLVVRFYWRGQFFESDRVKRGPVLRQVWHDKHPSQLEVRKRFAKANILEHNTGSDSV